MPRLSLASVSAEQVLFSLCTFVIVSALFLGGGTRGGFLSDALLQLLAIPLVLVSLWRLGDVPLSSRARWALVFCLVFVSTPLLQLVPLPPSIWTALPGREPVVADFELLGRELGWMPISISPYLTWLSALSVLVPLAVFLGVLLLDYPHRRYLSLVILAVGVLSVFLGLLQVAQGTSSGLYFFEFSNFNEAVGFFANRNHFAALLYVLTLFAAAWATNAALDVGSTPGGKRYESTAIVAAVVSFAVMAVLVAAQIITRSRAGFGLTIIAVLGAFALAYADRRSRLGASVVKLLIAAMAIALMMVSQFAFYRLMERFASDPMSDARPIFAKNTIKAAETFMPFGSGMGTFVPAYSMFEKPEDLLVDKYVNRAHNDFLELWLEAGVMGLGLMAIFAVWFLMRSFDIWVRSRVREREIDLSLMRAATMGIGLVALHSLVDYPLRTGAMAALIAFACALLIEPQVSAKRRTEMRSHDRRRTRSHEAQLPKHGGVHPPTPTWASSADQVERPRGPVPHPPPAGERWGEGFEWPEEWRKPPKRRDPDNEGD